MNNRIQQRFDRSISDAVAETKAARLNKPRRNLTPPKTARRDPEPRGRLFLCPETGATIWEPAERTQL